MHHYILVKIRGTSAEEAEETLKNEYLEQYCGENKPYDYYGDCTLITKDNIDILEIPCKTLKGLETFFKNYSTKDYEDVLKGIKRDLLHLHYHQYMSLE